jgi:hypothetical protein
VVTDNSDVDNTVTEKGNAWYYGYYYHRSQKISSISIVVSSTAPSLPPLVIISPSMLSVSVAASVSRHAPKSAC